MFVAFTGGYLQALVKKPGRYDARADVRGGTQMAVLDVLSGRTGPGKKVEDIPRFLRFAEKRAERPGLDAFVRVTDDGGGLEVVGPGEKVRPLALPEKLVAVRVHLAAAADLVAASTSRSPSIR